MHGGCAPRCTRQGRKASAIDHAEFHDDVCCIATAVRDFSGKTVGAIGLSAPVWRMGDDVRPERIAMLREAAHTLSQKLGYGGLSATYSPAMARLEKSGAPTKSPRVPAPSTAKAPAAKTAASKLRAKTAHAGTRRRAAK